MYGLFVAVVLVYIVFPCRKDQNLMSTVNCWYLVLEQTRRESRDHATLSDIYNNNVIVRLAHVGEDVIRLFKKVRIGIEKWRTCSPVTNAHSHRTYLFSVMTDMPTAWRMTPHKQIYVNTCLNVSGDSVYIMLYGSYAADHSIISSLHWPGMFHHDFSYSTFLKAGFSQPLMFRFKEQFTQNRKFTSYLLTAIYSNLPMRF